MTRKAFCYRFVGLLSIGLLSIGPSKAFSSSRQIGQELTESRKTFSIQQLEVKDRRCLKGCFCRRGTRELKQRVVFVLSVDEDQRKRLWVHLADREKGIKPHRSAAGLCTSALQ